ncbi:hypothetical protein GOODEAATRI_028172 [Goodea atripinnis]|uniref:Uncharacterized protein n=1 Tax=Goodea atripinnis TaxID=208336 RepID=A0ABV0P8F0_9TELE
MAINRLGLKNLHLRIFKNNWPQIILTISQQQLDSRLGNHFMRTNDEIKIHTAVFRDMNVPNTQLLNVKTKGENQVYGMSFLMCMTRGMLIKIKRLCQGQ